MEKYTIRVELHGAQNGDYNKLHSEMKKRNFSQTITGSNGHIYKLPASEYDFVGDNTIDGVLDSAKSAADHTLCTHEIIVTKSEARKWSGLTKVK